MKYNYFYFTFAYFYDRIESCQMWRCKICMSRLKVVNLKDIYSGSLELFWDLNFSQPTDQSPETLTI